MKMKKNVMYLQEVENKQFFELIKQTQHIICTLSCIILYMKNRNSFWREQGACSYSLTAHIKRGNWGNSAHLAHPDKNPYNYRLFKVKVINHSNNKENSNKFDQEYSCTNTDKE